MPLFRKKPVVIEAFNMDASKQDPEKLIWSDVCDWADRNGANIECWGFEDDHVIIPTLEGMMRAGAGDWIIKGVQGEFYPCKPDIFSQTYEAVGTPERGVQYGNNNTQTNNFGG